MIIGLGIDVIQIARFRRETARSGDDFLVQVLSPAELAYGATMHHPTPYHAARFAAKEALFKALGTGRRGAMSWHDVEVVHDDAGGPRILLRGETAREARERGVTRIHVSLTHEEEFAAAVVALEG